MSSPGRLAATALAIALALAVPACSDADRCDGATADALYLEVVDAMTGEAIEAEVTVEQDGEAVRVICSRRRTTMEPCLTWAAGYMRDGLFDVSVSADGYEPTTLTIDVLPGECGPMSVTQEIALTPVP